jgi:hypothetical protein
LDAGGERKCGFGKTAVGEEATGYLVLDAGGEETEAGGRGLYELKLVSHVGKR